MNCQLTASEPSGSLVVPDSPGARHQRMKVLVGAFACSPARGSEHGVGWGWIKAISKYHDLWVLTSDECRKDIEDELERFPHLGAALKFYFLPWKRHSRAERLWPPEHLMNYRRWQKRAFDCGKNLHEQFRFDIIHQLTYVGFRVPGQLWRLDAPFVWGPIGGLEQTTWALIPSLGLRGAVHFTARNLLNEWDRRFSALPKRSFRKASGGIISATRGVQREILRFYGRESIVISEIGVPPIAVPVLRRRSPGDPLRLLWCGLLTPWKALPFLLTALQGLPSSIRWSLTIIGEGSCTLRWKALAQKAGVAANCSWLGSVPRDLVLKRMQEAHALIVTSVHDLTSTVVIEALANGLPIICPDHCGFRDAVTPECGIRVGASTRDELVAGTRDAIVRMNDEDVRFRLAQGAFARSEQYGWERKGLAVDAIYRAKAAAAKGSANVIGGH